MRIPCYGPPHPVHISNGQPVPSGQLSWLPQVTLIHRFVGILSKKAKVLISGFPKADLRLWKCCVGEAGTPAAAYAVPVTFINKGQQSLGLSHQHLLEANYFPFRPLGMFVWRGWTAFWIVLFTIQTYTKTSAEKPLCVCAACTRTHFALFTRIEEFNKALFTKANK